MKKFLLFLCLTTPSLFGQITVSPAFPKFDAEITITIDLKLAKNSSATGLLGKTDIFLWSWGGPDFATKEAKYGPTGQTSFSQPFAPGQMTALGNDRWQIKLIPNQYLNVPAGQALKFFGCLAKNGPGTNQTEDFVFKLYDNSLQVAITQPVSKNFFADAGTQIPVNVKASQQANIQLLLDNTLITSKTDTSLSTNITVTGTPGQRRTVTANASIGSVTATDQFSYIVRPQPTIAPLPAGIRDGITYTSPTSVTLSLFAPNKSFVYLTGDFNNWVQNNTSLMNRTPDGQRYWMTINGLTSGREYVFQYLVDGSIAIGDPFSEKILDKNNDNFIPTSVYPVRVPFPTQAQGNIASVLQTGQMPYPWKIQNFVKPANTDLVIYEMLVRDFVGTQDIKNVMDSLSYLKRLGVNAIELMPVMEFAGNDSWGYNPIYFLAPDKAYGTRDAYKAFIDKCHEMGIAVILDMVLNHADFEFPYVKMYWDGTKPSADSPMFNPSSPHLYSVFFDFNHETAATKNYVDRVNEFWLKEYKFDGFRFDLSKGFTQKNSTTDAQMSAYDQSRVDILKRMYDKIRIADPSAIVILEHFAEDREEKDLTDYGMLVWANQNGDFRNALKNGGGNFSRLYHPNRSFTKPHAIGFAESHDEERLMFDALQNGASSGTYNVKTLKTALERSKALAAFLLLTPGPKMIWQFGEVGYDVSINENGRVGRKPIRWEYTRDTDRLKLFKVYAEMNKLRLNAAISRPTTFTPSTSGQFKTIQSTHSDFNTLVVANMGVEAFQWNGIATAGEWFDYFTGRSFTTLQNLNVLLEPGQFHVFTSKKLPTPEANLTPWSTLNPVTAIEVNTLTTSNVYPNPSQDVLVVELSDDYRGKIILEISDATGRKVNHYEPEKSSDKLTQHLPIKDLPGGSYLLRIEQNGKSETKRFVKQ